MEKQQAKSLFLTDLLSQNEIQVSAAMPMTTHWWLCPDFPKFRNSIYSYPNLI